MNIIILSLLAAVSALGAAPSSDQNPAGASARINACTVLLPDVAATFATATNTKVKSPPAEAPVGVNGSSCDYGAIALHINPFAVVSAERMRKSPQKDWVPVSGVGDAAYLHSVQDVLAEMLVWRGSHHFGILVDVPAGSTAEQIKPHIIQVANQIIPRLK